METTIMRLGFRAHNMARPWEGRILKTAEAVMHAIGEEECGA